MENFRSGPIYNSHRLNGHRRHKGVRLNCTVWHYRYDALGRRADTIRLVEDGQTPVEHVAFAWDGATLCEQTSRADSLPRYATLSWDHDGLRPLTQAERISSDTDDQSVFDERFFAIVTDLIGTPTELVDEDGQIAWRTRSTLWGKVAWAAGSSAYTPLRFPGQYFDPESGLHSNQALL